MLRDDNHQTQFLVQSGIVPNPYKHISVYWLQYIAEEGVENKAVSLYNDMQR